MNLQSGNMQIVHIEDDRPLRDILRLSMELMDAKLILQQFVSGDEAFPYILQHKDDIDLFLLDIRLPGTLNGLEIAERLRCELHVPGHIVITSAYASPAPDVLRRLQAQYYPKPWHILDITPKLLQYKMKHALPPVAHF
jgi:CheY-like chemotaxis protein